MTVKENMNFNSVRLCKALTMEFIRKSIVTKHFVETRCDGRMSAIKKILTPNEFILTSFRVDKFHKNGAEIHSISNNGLIFIHNERTMKLVTVLIARPNQVKRLFNDCGLKASQSLIEQCAEHQRTGLNGM